MKATLAERYGQWAVVAGASEGLGAAFAEALAKQGVNLLLVARRAGVLGELCATLARTHGVEVRAVAADLADPSFMARIEEQAVGLAIGIGVYNAAYAPVGAFAEQPLDELLRVVDVNVRGPLCFARALAPAMIARRRGALVLVSSLAGFQGSPRIATYAASKAFGRVLAEGLWGELGPQGIDVVASCAGAIRTPGYQRTVGRDAPGTLDAGDVAAQTLAALGKGPVVVPGAVNKLASAVMGRLLPRSTAVAVMRSQTRGIS